MKREYVALVVCLCIGLLSSSAFARSCSSRATGNWSASGTWQGCGNTIPQAGDTVTINSGNVVTQDISSNNVASVTINTGATLSQQPWLSSLTLTVSGDLINNGVILQQPFIGTATVTVGGNVTNNGGGTIDSSGGFLSTVNWNVAGSLMNNGSFTAGVGAIGVAGSLTNNGGGTIDLSAGDADFSLGGNYSNGGAFTAGNGTFTLNGSGAQSLNNALSVSTLVINNSGSGVTLSANLTVSNVLTLADGIISTGSNSLIYSPNCSTSNPAGSSASFVYGNLRLTFPSGAATCTFPVGSGTSLYAPITMAFTSSGGGTLTATTQPDTGGAQESAAGLVPSGSVGRYWTLSRGTIAFSGSYSATMRFNNPADLGASANPANFIVRLYSGGSWTSPTVGTRTSTTTQATGMTQSAFGTLVVGNSAAVSAANSTVVASPASVPADNSTTSTITVTLNDGSGNPVSGKSITLASSSSTSTVTTLIGTTNSGGIATFTVKDGTPETVTYTATDATDNVVVAQTAQVTFTATLCFNDDFAGNGTPSGYWSIGTESGSFTPALVSNRLRLTNTGTTESTWVTLNKYFPGAGNQLTVEFDHYAYGGSGGTGGANSGADGIAVILSDASVAPAAGAFGGSLGYAQKGQNPVSDCNVSGGCVGFAGGWMGTGIDEYGNFQNPTEGRYGGPGQVSESVSIRGSGSGMAGYRYIAGTSTLSPKIDNNGSANPAYRYRIIVDHLDGIHAWVSVERDTASGGAAYQTILGAKDCTTTVSANCLDIKNASYSQSSVPTNWRLSFTGASGAATNTHEIDALKVCTAQNIITPTLDHLAIYEPGSACTGSNNPASITIKACADAACSSLYLGTVTANLSVSGSASWSSSNPVTISGGQATLTLRDNTAESVTLGASASSPTALNSTVCYNSAGNAVSCANAVTFSKCYFDAIETSDSAAPGPIYTKLSGTSFNLNVWNISGSSQTVTKVETVDANTGTPGVCSSYDSVTSSSGSWSISNNAYRQFSFTASRAVRNARIRITTASSVSCSSDNFAIRPTQLSLSTSAGNAAATGAPVVRAGSAFSITAAGGTGYDGTPKFNLSTAGTMTGTATLGTLSATTFAAGDSSGNAIANGVTYSQVGNVIFNLANVVYDDTFTLVDSTKASPECTPDFSTTLASGKYGCMIGSPTPPTLGRFIPHHFDTALTPGCATGAFTYSGQPFSATITASNASGGTTTNYQGSYARNVTLTDGSGAAVSCTHCSVMDTSFSGGTVTLNGATTQPTFTFNAPLTAPATLTLRATETGGDGVTSNATGASEGTTALRSGRLRLSNAFGSEKTSLAMPVQAQYWSGVTWVLNSGDSCTNLPANAFALSSALTTVSGAMAIAGGNGTLSLTAPGAGHVGSVDIAANLGATNQDASCLASHGGVGANVPWLRSQFGNCAAAIGFTADPSARATFGVYTPESRRTVHVREAF